MSLRADTVTSEKNQCGFLLFMVVRKIKDNVYIQPTFKTDDREWPRYKLNGH